MLTRVRGRVGADPQRVRSERIIQGALNRQVLASVVTIYEHKLVVGERDDALPQWEG